MLRRQMATVARGNFFRNPGPRNKPLDCSTFVEYIRYPSMLGQPMMARKKSQSEDREELRSLTDVEWAIMRSVWQHEPCAAGTVQEALVAEHGWAYSTVKTTMDRMVVKGLLATHSIRNLQLFTSRISPSDAKRVELRRLLKRAFDGALAPMIQFLVEQEDLSEKEIKELRGLLQSKRRKE
jgi:BlaI family transcriptional regulator, penicillinase repressor